MGMVHKTSFSSTIQVGNSVLKTAFSFQTQGPKHPVKGHPLIAFVYLSPASLKKTEAETDKNHVGFFFFGPGVTQKNAGAMMLQALKGALGKGE
jgi:hypothetical protein